MERLSERGGFAPSEMDAFLPDWRERTDENVRLRADLAAAIAAKEEGEGKLCAARETLDKFKDANGMTDFWRDRFRAALSSSSPCRHAAEADKMREEGKRLDGVIGWAIETAGVWFRNDLSQMTRKEWLDELIRRRADAALKGGTG